MATLLDNRVVTGKPFAAAHERFAQQAAARPAAVALRCGDASLSYGDLNERANRIAHRLRALGVQPGDLVSVCLERGPELVAGILGVLKAGAGYVPIDPVYPAERIAFVLRDAVTDVVVSQRSLVERLNLHDRTVLNLEEDLSGYAGSDPSLDVTPESTAYVIYTSGSTGEPKGVVITQRNLSHYLSSLPPCLGIRSDDVYLHTASIAFSSSVRQLFAPLSLGAECVLARRELTENPVALFGEIKRRNVTVVDFVPSYWRASNQALRALPDAERAALLDNRLRLIVSASEPLPTDVVQEWRSVLGMHTQAINMFGQTETTGIVATFPIPDDLSGIGRIMPVGRPIPDTGLYLLNEGQEVPEGNVGEVYVAGGGVGAGYLNRPEQTAVQFVAHPTQPALRLYRTGDRGQLRADGVLEFVGRGDEMVKIRGFRVELEEVEAGLRAHAAVREAAVVAREEASGENRLIAFVALAAGQPPTATQLRRHLQRTLPDYMIPAQFALMSSLPRTPNGKLDRRTLANLDTFEWLGGEAYRAPETRTEKVIAEIWAELLEAPRVGVNDGFLELGGHSLMAHRVAVRLRQALGVDVPLRDLLQTTTVRELAERIDSNTGDLAALAGIVAAARDRDLELSSPQQRLWLLTQINPESTAYNLSAGLHLRGGLNVAALERALTEVVRRHESLRTTFPTRDGGARQMINVAGPVPLPVVEVAAGDHQGARARELAEAEVRRVFNLETGPLFRALLLRLGEQEHILVLSLHHIISDGWSRGVLYREIATLYGAFSENADSPLPELQVQYVDFAEWQRSWLQSETVANQLGYWKHQLSGSLPLLDLPTDHVRPAVQSGRGAALHFKLPAELTEHLRALGAQEQATLFMTLLAAFKTLLQRYSGQAELVVGSPAAGRSHTETENLIGFFVNTLVLRTDLSGDPSFRELLRRVREVAHGAYEHQDVPFERLVDALGATRDLSRAPVFQAMFIVQNTPTRPVRLRGLRIDPIELDAGASKFDLTMSLVVDDNGLTGSIEYSTDLFEAGTIERMSAHYGRLLEGVVANPDARLSEMPVLTDAERQHLITDVNATAAVVPSDLCVHQQFEQQVERTPDACALVFEGKSLTYRELNERANQLAHHLQSLGARPDTLVGICVPRSIEMMVGLLGILKAGAAYLPLDPSYPRERLAVMIEDSGVPLMLSVADHANDLPVQRTRVVLLDEQADWRGGPTGNPASGARTENLAYVIYTSGSTGKPKGVMVEHRNVVNFFAGMDERLGGDKPGTWLAVTSISFDISVLELFWSLTRGFQVVIQSEEGLLAGSMTPAAATRQIDFSFFYFAANEQSNPGDKYRLLLEGARFADANGFSAVWTPERHFHSFGGLYPNPSVTSAALAMITKNVQLRAGSVVLPLHHPLRVAEEWSVVDNLSNGRVGIAIASGWHDRDFVFAPQNYAQRREIMQQGIDSVRRLWRGESIKAVTGAGKETDVSILPRPIQPEIPIWVTAAGTPDTYRAAGEMGANVLTHLLGQTVDQLRDKIEMYRQARREAGHEGEGIVSLMMHTYVGDDLEAVRARVFKPFREYLRTSVGLVKELAEGRGQDLRSPSFTAEDMEALLDHAFDRYWQTAALLGTPETCLEVVERLKGIGVDEVACLIDFGVDDADVIAGFERLAEVKNRANLSSELDENDYSVGAQIHRHQVTHLQCTPSLATMLLAQPGARHAFAGLRTIMLGGEAFPSALATELRRVSGARILNMYGPTETTIWSSTHTVAGKGESIPLGAPIANTQFYVLNSAHQLQPVGVPGELLIGGAGVVRGYLNRPELTRERFVADPFRPGNRLYRTGDLVRYRSTGELEFLGRTDYQVKILGHRIELGEIEAVIARRPEVRECVVVAREDARGDKRLAAYVVSVAQGTVDVAALRNALREALPEFMVPSHIVQLADLPRTPNNKIDRKALPAPELLATKLPLGEFTAPANDLERKIAETWQGILRVPHVGTTDNFFDLGGNSFLAVRVHAQLRSTLGIEMPLTTLFRFPTVGALAAHLGDGAAPSDKTTESGADRAELRRQAMRRRRQLQ